MAWSRSTTYWTVCGSARAACHEAPIAAPHAPTSTPASRPRRAASKSPRYSMRGRREELATDRLAAVFERERHRLQSPQGAEQARERRWCEDPAMNVLVVGRRRCGFGGCSKASCSEWTGTNSANGGSSSHAMYPCHSDRGRVMVEHLSRRWSCRLREMRLDDLGRDRRRAKRIEASPVVGDGQRQHGVVA